MSKKILKAVARDLTPLSPIPSKKLPSDVEELDVLKAYLVLIGEQCPTLMHLPEFGFDVETTRQFLSAFAGQTIRVPAQRTLSRVWNDLSLWVEVRRREQTKGIQEAIEVTACNHGLTKERVARIHAKFELALGAVRG